MSIRLLCTGLVALTVPALAEARLADVVCDDRTRLEHQLSTTMGVVRQGRGMRGAETLIEIWIEPRSGDWTLVQSYPNGTACVVAIGEHWEFLTPAPDPA